MKITLTTSMSGLGGTENATFRLGRLLKQRGHDIVLASSDGPLIQEAQALGIRWQPIDFYQGGLLGYVKGMFAYMKLLKKEKPDVIHCQMARIVPACAIAAKFASPKTKVFYHARGLDPELIRKLPSFSTSWAYTSSATANTNAKNSSVTVSLPTASPTLTTLCTKQISFLKKRSKTMSNWARFPVWTPSAPCT